MKHFLALLCLVACFSSQRTQSQPKVDSLKQALAQKSPYTTGRVDVLNRLAHDLSTFDPKSSFNFASEALSQSIIMNYRSGECEADLNLADYYFERGAFEESLKKGLAALYLSELEQNSKQLMSASYLMGIVYRELKDSAKSRYYIKKADSLANEISDNEMLARISNTQGVFVGLRQRNLKAGLPYFIRALELAEHQPEATIKVYALSNIGRAYVAMGNPEKAVELYNEALRIAQEQFNKRGEASIYQNMGDIYWGKNQYDLAEQYYKKSAALAVQIGSKRLFMPTYIALIGLMQSQGKMEEAHEYQKKYSMTRDSIFSASKAQHIAELEARFESSLKEKEIQRLEEKSQAQQLWQKVLVVGVLLTLGVAIWVYRLQQSRSAKTRELLEIQRLLNEKLTEIDRMKSSFFASISHELRTPLTLILAPLEEELKKGLQGRDALVLAQRNAKRLLELINQLLDLSKLEAGKMQLHLCEGSPSQLLQVLTSSFHSLASRKQINFITDIRTTAPVWYDDDKLEKIVVNLLSNAFKFTPAHGIVKFGAEMNGTALQIVVSDTGCGIAKDQQERIFTPFYQIRQTSEPVVSGTGLGLSLVKEIVKLYRGTIRCESEPGKGTTFFVSLPIHLEQFPEGSFVEVEACQRSFYTNELAIDLDQDEQQPGTLQTESILIVEDDPDLLNYMSSRLRGKYNVIKAKHGEEAIQIAIHSPPSIILSDLMMPVLDGVALTSRLKSDGRTHHIPVILLTGKNEQASLVAGFKAGADDYITKPFSMDELTARIDNLITLRKQLSQRSGAGNTIL